MKHQVSNFFSYYLLFAYMMMSNCFIYAHDRQLSKLVERSIVVVVASYNNLPWYCWNLDSVFSQNYSNYRVIYIDDCSTDGTYELVKAYIAEKQQEDRVELIHNDIHRGALANQYRAIHSCKDTDIIIILDGDDRFAHNEVLACINHVYADPNIWLTYGQFKDYPSGNKGFCIAMPAEVVEKNTFREMTHIPSHLRTFYAGLFKRINKDDLMYEEDFFQMTGDIAAMFPMIEMARNGHFKFISEILLEYNSQNVLNDHKVVKGLQRQLDLVIRERNRYKALQNLFNDEDSAAQASKKKVDAKPRQQYFIRYVIRKN